MDREIAGKENIARIMARCEAVSVAFGGEGPYVIPMSFGFAEREGRFTLYLHGARQGEKIDRMRADPRAAFAMFTGNRVHGAGDTACGYSTSFDSVCGEGTLRVLEDEEKRLGLDAIMAHYAPGRTFEYATLDAACVMALDVARVSGKHHD